MDERSSRIAKRFELPILVAALLVRLRWLRDHPLEVVIVVLTPPFLPASLQALRALRLLRVLRLLRLVGLTRSLFSLDGLRYVGMLAALTALGGGAAFAAVEGKSTWDGVWWAVVTMTTVGYGDVPITTVEGRLIGIGVMIVGIGFVALLTAALAERFLASRVVAAEEEVAERIDEAEADVVAELREITDRLRRLEQRLGSSPT